MYFELFVLVVLIDPIYIELLHFKTVVLHHFLTFAGATTMYVADWYLHPNKHN